MMRVPLPLKREVQELINRFHEENLKYLSLPLEGHWSEVLGISPNATAEEVTEAYRRLAKAYHPDVNLKLDAVDRTKAINKAYEESGAKH
jgi:DnaJ-class molecular chaperone